MRIDFFIDSMGPGGAERVASLLVNRWAAMGHEVRLMTLTDSTTDYYRLDPAIERVSIGLLGPTRSGRHGLVLNVRRTARIARLLASHPDAAVSFTSRMNVLVIIAARLVRASPVVVSERSNPAVHPVPRSIDLARRRLYAHATTVVAQTDAAARWINANCSGARTTVIPNPVDDLPFVDETQPHLVVAAGRLGPEKGFDMLLQAMVVARKRHPQARLHIYGDGPERTALQGQISELGLDNVVSLKGLYDNVATALGGAAVFVLSSRYEGFPNVLLEAMRVGTPPVAFACDYGPAEIVKHDESGRLVCPGDVGGLAIEIIRLLDDGSVRERLRSGARHRAERFDLKEVALAWDEALHLGPTSSRHDA